MNERELNDTIVKEKWIDTTGLEAFSKNKEIPNVIHDQVLYALSYYPELKDVHIRFRFKQKVKGSTMVARPEPASLIGRRKNRQYNILISSLFELKHTALPIHQLPDSILVGWFGHELGHIMDYERRSTWNIIGFGLSYVLSKKYLQRAEQTADRFAIEHGMAPYIIETKHFILDNADIPDAYKEKISRLYLSPDEIEDQVRELEEQHEEEKEEARERTEKLEKRKRRLQNEKG